MGDDLLANPLIPSEEPAGGIDLNHESLAINEAIHNEILELKEKEHWIGAVRLHTGRLLAVKPSRTPLSEHHYIAYFPSCQGTPDYAERLEMLNIVMRFAWFKGEEIYGDSEAFTLLHNGAKTVSFPDTHYHIFIMPDQATKTEVYGRLYQKNMQ